MSARRSGPGDDEAPLVAGDAVAKPLRPGLRANEDEQSVRAETLRWPRRLCRAGQVTGGGDTVRRPPPSNGDGLVLVFYLAQLVLLHE